MERTARSSFWALASGDEAGMVARWRRARDAGVEQNIARGRGLVEEGQSYLCRSRISVEMALLSLCGIQGGNV